MADLLWKSHDQLVETYLSIYSENSISDYKCLLRHYAIKRLLNYDANQFDLDKSIFIQL